MSALLGLKVTLVPILIFGITLAGRRWGPAVAGWLSAFPVVTAPILFIIAKEQGRAFAAASAAATLSAVLANLCFGLTYAWSATRHSWPTSVVIGMLSFAGAIAALNRWAASLPLVGVVVFVSLAIARYMYPVRAGFSPASSPCRRGDLLLRMAAGGVLVVLVTGFALRLGPRMSGLLAMFPVMASVLAVFSHRQYGAAFVILLLRNMVWGYFAFAVFCVVLAVCLPVWPVSSAFVAALGAALVVQAMVRFALG